jgi:two-component sensor histidine kinase
MVSSLINLHSRNEKNEESRNRLEDLKSQIKSIGMIHEKLYQSENYSTVNFQDQIQDIVGSLFSGFENKDVIVSLKMKDISLDVSTSIPLGLMLNELTTNAIKYGFNTESPHEFSIKMRRGKKKGNYILKVKNTGNPFPDDIDFQNTDTMGMQLLCIFNKQLGGTIELNRDEGTEFIITFPAN